MRTAAVRRFDWILFALLVFSGWLGAAVVRLTYRIETRQISLPSYRHDPVVVRRT
jgi:hypothetical protein